MNIHVTSDGLTKENGVFPDLRVTLRAQELHAPLVERMVELPMDIAAGVCFSCCHNPELSPIQHIHNVVVVSMFYVIYMNITYYSCSYKCCICLNMCIYEHAQGHSVSVVSHDGTTKGGLEA